MINITDNFRVNKPAPIDDRLGPFLSTALALSSIELDRRYIGLTVIVDDGTGAVDYWFKDGVSNGDLEAKSNGGGGGGVPYTGATQDLDLGTHDLYTNKVYLYDEPNDNHGSIHYTDGDFHIEHANGDKLLVLEDGFMQLHLTDSIQSNLFTSNLTQTRDHYLPNQSGTIALTSDLSGKVDSNAPITGATKTKITYDSKGLVTAGADLAIADLPTTVPYGYTAPIASIVSGGVTTETQLTTVTIPAGAFKNGDNILITIWGTRTTGASSGVNSTISLRVTNTSGAQMMTNQTGNRHQNFTITGRVLSDTSIIWWQNSPTTSALTTTVPSLLNSGFTISIGLIRTNTTDEFTLYNAIVRKYS